MISFAYPGLLYLLLIIPALAALFWLSRIARTRKLRRYGRPEVLASLMPDASRYMPWVKLTVALLALAFLIIVLARPRAKAALEDSARETETSRGIEVMVCLDVSNSMLASSTDDPRGVARLDRAKHLLERLVGSLRDDRVGLIVFAGDAFTQLPITSDYISAKMFLSSINPSMVSTQGTAIGAAINLAARSFTPDETTDKAIILITDGENHEDDAIGAAKAAAEKGIHVNIVGMGDPKGSPIPIQGSNNYMKDKDGNVVITKLNEQMGQEIAAAGNGMYVRADNTNSALKALQKEIEKMNKTELDSKVYSEYDEQFQIFAWIALFLLIADFMTLDRKNRIFRKVKLFS